MLPVEQPFKVYTGINGRPLQDGFIYFGDPNENPITSPVTVYWDAAGTIPAAQPLRTNNGYIMRGGTPANVFFDGDYSQLVQDKNKQQVFYARTSEEFSISAAVSRFLSDIGGGTGALLMGFIQSGIGAVKRTALIKMREIEPSVDDFYSGTGDHVEAVQAAAISGNFSFKSGRTYNLSNAEIRVPANRRITVEKGAIVNCANVRFCSHGVDANNVEYDLRDFIRLTSMSDAGAKQGWPNTADGTQDGNERGFIEFGGDSVVDITASGFLVHGSGGVIGPWSGTPNFSEATQAYQVNRKGIAVWNAKNIKVREIDISGFDGEAVYFRGSSPDCVNVDFDDLYVHDTRFNGPNFNCIGPYRGLKIRNCRVINAYQGIESSVGAVTDNYIENMVRSGIYFGVGSGTGPIEVSGNTVVKADGVPYYLAFNESLEISKVDIFDNRAIDGAQNAYILQGCSNFTFKNNTSSGHGRTSAGFAFNIYKCRNGIVDGNVALTPGPFSSGDRLITDCKDVTVGIGLTTSTTGLPPTYWYDEGYWTPTPNGLVVSGGTVVYVGTYTRIGRMIYWQINIRPLGAATTESMVVDTNFTGLPFTAALPSTCQAITTFITPLPNGYLAASTIYPPPWAATNNEVILNGSFHIDPTIPM